MLLNELFIWFPRDSLRVLMSNYRIVVLKNMIFFFIPEWSQLSSYKHVCFFVDKL